MRSWFEGLDARQRMIVVGGGGLAAALLVWAFLWQPFAAGLRDLERTVAAQEENLRWMQEAAAEIRQLRGALGRTGDLGGRSLLSVVDQSARSAGLGGGIRRVEPEGEHRVRVRMENVPFDMLVGWLAALHRQHGVRVTQVTIEKDTGPGRVDVRLTLET